MNQFKESGNILIIVITWSLCMAPNHVAQLSQYYEFNKRTAACQTVQLNYLLCKNKPNKQLKEMMKQI